VAFSLVFSVFDFQGRIRAGRAGNHRAVCSDTGILCGFKFVASQPGGKHDFLNPTLHWRGSVGLVCLGTKGARTLDTRSDQAVS